LDSPEGLNEDVFASRTDNIEIHLGLIIRLKKKEIILGRLGNVSWIMRSQQETIREVYERPSNNDEDVRCHGTDVLNQLAKGLFAVNKRGGYDDGSGILPE
jgi:hypothetical protein